MAMTVRTTGTMLILLALAALSWDVMTVIEVGRFKLTAWGDLWHQVHPASLSDYQHLVERKISAELWDRVLAPLLLYKAVFVFAIPGLTLSAMPGLMFLLRQLV